VSGGGDKTEKPTPKRRRDARRKGQIARTSELGGWLVVLAATWLLPATARWGYAQCRRMLAQAGEVVLTGDGDLLALLGDAVARGSIVMAPLALAATGIGVATTLVQIGWAPKPLKPDVKRLNPFTGLKSLFGPRLATEGLKNVAKLALVSLLAVGPTRDVWQALVATGGGTSVLGLGTAVAAATVDFLRTAALAGLVIAAADYWSSRRRTDKQVKMTRREVADEHKQSEGDPHLKGQIRSRQVAMTRNRMMAAVPTADVVLTNPTHVAVALRYDPSRGAPQVVAKGAGAVADRIRSLAVDAGVPIVCDVPLARACYRLCEVQAHIPVELYEAVARVLAFVMALRARGRAAGTHQSPFAAAHSPLLDLATGPRPPRPRTPART
jgi:flagellar biosynthesis protein FlhB